MTLWEAVRTARELLDDWGGDRTAPWDVDDRFLYVSNARLADLIDQARSEVFHRTPRVDTDSALTAVTVDTADAGDVPLDARVVLVDRVHPVGRAQPLPFMPVEDLDAQRPGWRDLWGEPWGWTWPADEVLRLRLVPAPVVDLPVRLAVRRMPLTTLTWEGSAAAEIDEVTPVVAHHLPYWAAARVLEARDQGGDAKLALYYDGLFERLAGPPVSQEAARLRRRLAAGPLRVGVAL